MLQYVNLFFPTTKIDLPKVELEFFQEIYNVYLPLNRPKEEIERNNFTDFLKHYLVANKMTLCKQSKQSEQIVGVPPPSSPG